MTETVRTPAHQHIIDARIREADLIAGVVHEYIVQTRNLSFAERIDTNHCKDFVTPYFGHLAGIEKAFVIAQVVMKISNVLFRAERQRLEAEDA